MRPTAHAVANAVAWALVLILVVVALLVARRFGFAGLLLLGGLTWLVCLRAELDADVPT